MELAEGNVLHYPVERCPANFINLVGSRVEVLTVNHAKFTGSIYSMDPISGSLFMMSENPQDERSIKLMVGSSIKCLKILKLVRRDNGRSIMHQQQGSPGQQQDWDWRETLESLKLWLQQSRIPLAQDGPVLVIGGEVRVSPPYGTDNCSSLNEVALWRVRQLLETFHQQRQQK